MTVYNFNFCLFLDLKAVKDFIVPPKNRTVKLILTNFLLKTLLFI